MDVGKNKRKTRKVDIRKTYIKDIIPINGLPAIFIPKLNSTVISDLHIGYENELVMKGIFLYKDYTEQIIKRIEKIFSIIKSKKIIINGDLKHKFSKFTKKEKRKIASFLFFIKNLYEDIIIIRGNHDTYLRPIAKEYSIEILDYYYDKNILILHGHKKFHDLEDSEIVIIGHEHPSLLLKDEYGHFKKYPAILFFPTILNNVLVVLPSFSYLQTGNPINKDFTKNTFLSEITKNFAIVEEGIPLVIKEGKTIELPRLKEIITFNNILQ